MESKDIIYILKNKINPKIVFAGVLSSDEVREFEIPLVRERPICFIANILKEKDLRLGHWTVFLISTSPNHYIYFYDSYGLNPDFYSVDFKYFIKKYKTFNLYTYNRKLQSDSSIVCGLYCAYFVYYISRYNIRRVLDIIKQNFPTSKYNKNDANVFHFYSKKLNTFPCFYWKNIDKSLVTYKQCLLHLNKKNKGG